MNKYLTELIGTFFLVLSVGMTNNPFAVGTMLMVMIYMGAHVSGAHYNPSVTLAMYLRKKILPKDTVMYILFQFIGAIFAALIYYLIMNRTFAVAPGLGVPVWKAILVEVIFTLALVLVIMNVAATAKTAGNGYFGIAIGFTVVASAFAAGPISGGAFNMAVGVGPLLVDTIFGGSSIGNVLIYIVGPLLGGLLAVPVYYLMNPEEPKTGIAA
jgi:glycerol uptake facilitator-like aquaporin